MSLKRATKEKKRKQKKEKKQTNTSFAYGPNLDENVKIGKFIPDGSRLGDYITHDKMDIIEGVLYLSSEFDEEFIEEFMAKKPSQEEIVSVFGAPFRRFNVWSLETGGFVPGGQTKEIGEEKAVLWANFSLEEVHAKMVEEINGLEASFKDEDSWLSDYPFEAERIVMNPYIEEGLSFYVLYRLPDGELEEVEGLIGWDNFGNFNGCRPSFDALSAFVLEMVKPIKDRIGMIQWDELKTYCRDSSLQLEVMFD